MFICPCLSIIAIERPLWDRNKEERCFPENAPKDLKNTEIKINAKRCSSSSKVFGAENLLTLRAISQIIYFGKVFPVAEFVSVPTFLARK